MSKYIVPAIVLALSFSAACGVHIGDETGPTQVQTVTVPTAVPTASPSPTAAPTGNGVSGPVTPVSVRVGIYGQSCSSGGAIPNNAENTIRVDCVALLTATPKDAQGNDYQNIPDAVWAAAVVTWNISGAACLDLNAVDKNANQFNRELKGRSAGSCSVCATVWGVTGCARQPTGEQAVKVIS